MKNTTLPENIDFSHMQFPKTQNYFCMVPGGMFEFVTKPESPLFDCSVDQLVLAWKTMVKRQPRLKLRSDSESKHRYHYTYKSWPFGFLSYFIVQFFPVDENRSTLLMYSYSVLGLYDLGMNQVRVFKYLIQLKKQLDLQSV